MSKLIKAKDLTPDHILVERDGALLAIDSVVAGSSSSVTVHLRQDRPYVLGPMRLNTNQYVRVAEEGEAV